jgi:hypothetical protein
MLVKIMSIMPVGETMMPVGETMMPVGETMMTVGENPVRASRLWLAARLFVFKNTIEWNPSSRYCPSVERIKK